MQLILASASARRQELIRLLGMHWQVWAAEVDESSVVHQDPASEVLQTAQLKALAVAAQAPEHSLVLAADTMVVLGDVRFGKPDNADEARAMLRSLRGRTHQVHTGIAIINKANGQRAFDVATIDVPMRSYSESEVEAYIATGDPLDKAGAYAIQHPEFRPVATLAGCYAGVVGLPLCHVVRALKQVEFVTKVEIAAACQAHFSYECPIYQTILRQVT